MIQSRQHPRARSIAAALAGLILSSAAASASAQETGKAHPDTHVQRGGAISEGQLLPNWRRLRTSLDDWGIDLQLDYTTETAWNVSGGRRQGADYAHQIGLAATIDWDKLAGVPGLQTHTIFVNRAGRNTSADYIGDPVIQAQEIYGAGFNMGLKLVSFFAEETLWDGRVDLAAGRLAVGSDFAASSHYCNFMTLTICGHPRALTSNQGFTDWPTASWGGRIRARPTADTYVMAGIYESKPFPPGGRTGWDWSTDDQTGQTFPVEFAWEPVLGAGRLPGHYKLGLAYDNSEFPDNYVDEAGVPFVISRSAPRLHNGRTSLWATADQMLVRNGPGDNDGLIALAAYAHNTPDISLFKHFVWVGVLNRGFWSARPNDQFGLAVTYYKVSGGITDSQRLQQSLGLPFGAGIYGVQSDAFVLEANYNIAIYRGVEIQPEIEYFIRPGGQSSIDDSLVLGLKTHVQF